MKIEKEDVELFSIEDIILYIENLKESTKQLLKISEFNKVSEYKIKIKKSNVPIYTSNK